MSIATRSAETTWAGALETGAGTFTASSSSVLDHREVTWASRIDRPDGRTSPEELAAAAHSSCFAMALSLLLGKNGTPPTTLRVEAAVTLDEVDGRPTITTSRLQVRATVPGLDDGAFQTVVADAAQLCPVSRLFAGATVNVDATLVEA